MFISFSSLSIIPIGSLRRYANQIVHIQFYRSHDGFIELPSGLLEAKDSTSLFVSQEKVFDDLGRDLLKNAFDGQTNPPL